MQSQAQMNLYKHNKQINEKEMKKKVKCKKKSFSYPLRKVLF